MPGPYKGFPRGAEFPVVYRSRVPAARLPLIRPRAGPRPPSPKGEGFYPKNSGSFSSSFSIARPRWLMASFSSGVSCA